MQTSHNPPHSSPPPSSSTSTSSASNPSPHSSSSSRPQQHPPLVNEYEILYNSAVQSFVRRDHIRAQEVLGRLLDLSKGLQRDKRRWYDLSPQSSGGLGEGAGKRVKVCRNGTKEGYKDQGSLNGERGNNNKDSTNGSSSTSSSISGEEWVIKTLKLVVSAAASLYTDPPRDANFEKNLQSVLPPASPASLLAHIQSTCESTYFHDSSSFADSSVLLNDSQSPLLLPPQLVSTFLLAALKLRPSNSALSFAHQFTEDWLIRIPDDFILAISSPIVVARAGGGGVGRKASTSASENGMGDAEEKRRVEVAREGYLKVLELFVGEVLGREGEWEMAKGILEGDSIMSSKRKEALYRHIRALESAKSNPSLTDSGILPSPTDSISLPSPSNSGLLPAVSTCSVPYPLATKSSSQPQQTSSRSRGDSTSSTSSSSSERTARPLSMQTARPGPFSNGPSNGNSNIVNEINPSSRVTLTSHAQHWGEKYTIRKPQSVSTPQPNSYGDISKRGLSNASSIGDSVNESNSPSRRPHQNHTRRVSALETVYAILPSSVQRQLTSASHNKWIQKFSKSTYPVPVLIILATLSIIRIRQRRLRGLVAAGAGASVGTEIVEVVRAGVNGGGGIVGTEKLRDQLKLIRRRSAWEWLVWWFKWWVGKFAGVWKLGTTITYV